MKKILAILMCAAMLLCIAPVGAVAADTEALPSGTAINSENGLGAITGSGDFYLAEDIYVDLTTATLPLIADGFTGTLDGNGHSIIFKDKTTGALKNTATLSASGGIIFKVCTAKSVKNLTVGSPDAPAVVTSNQANVGVLAMESNARLSFESVTVYGELISNRSGTMNYGLFMAKGKNNIEFNSCAAIGKITVNVQGNFIYKLGGFMGTFTSTGTGGGISVAFNNCISDVAIGAAEGITIANGSYGGGLLGCHDCANRASNFTANNCISLKTPVMKNSAGKSAMVGPFFGGVLADGDPVANTDEAKAERVSVTSSATLDTLAEELALTTDRAASVRFDAPTGIRYRHSVSGLYDTLVALCGAENVKLGTLIAPVLFVNDAGAFTKEALDALEGINSERYIDVPFGGEWYSDMKDNTYTYVGSIANVLEQNYSVEFAGIGYISYKLGDEWTTVYADYAVVEGQSGIPAYSVSYLADCVVRDAEANPDKYTASELAAVQKYLPKED